MGHCFDSLCHVDCDAADVVPAELDLAGAAADANVEREAGDGVADRGRGTQCASGAVESLRARRRPSTSPHALGTVRARRARHRCRGPREPHSSVGRVRVGQVVRRADDVGEHDRGEHAIGVDRCVAASDKLGDRIEQRAGITREQGVLTREQHRVGAGDVRRDVVGLRMLSFRASAPKHESGYTNRSEHGAEIRHHARSISPIAMLRRGGQVDATLVPLIEPQIAAKRRRGPPVDGFVARSFQAALERRGRKALRIIVASEQSGRRVEQNQAVNTLGMCRREQETRLGGETQHDRTVDPQLVE